MTLKCHLKFCSISVPGHWDCLPIGMRQIDWLMGFRNGISLVSFRKRRNMIGWLNNGCVMLLFLPIPPRLKIQVNKMSRKSKVSTFLLLLLNAHNTELFSFTKTLSALTSAKTVSVKRKEKNFKTRESWKIYFLITSKWTR